VAADVFDYSTPAPPGVPYVQPAGGDWLGRILSTYGQVFAAKEQRRIWEAQLEQDRLLQSVERDQNAGVTVYDPRTAAPSLQVSNQMLYLAIGAGVLAVALLR